MTAVGLIDKDGRTYVQWLADRHHSFHELCVDPLTGLHHALFHTLSFDIGETACFSDSFQPCSFCSATINLLTNEVKEGGGRPWVSVR